MSPGKDIVLAVDDNTLSLDAQSGFHIIGKGSIGGKARGLAFVMNLLASSARLKDEFPDVRIDIPETVVISDSCFEAFISENGLHAIVHKDPDDQSLADRFVKGRMPKETEAALRDFLKRHTYPLAVRSSGLLEDARSHAYAGLYRSYMLSNDQPDFKMRLHNLMHAVKLVYASTFYEGPRAYAKRVGHPFASSRMAVIIQALAGRPYSGYYYPAISGVAHSRNFYPQTGTKPDEGIAAIALGLGRQVVSGGSALRFCPKYPQRLFQRNSVEEILAYSQRRFFALELNSQNLLDHRGRDHSVQRQITDAADESPVKMLAGTYVLAEHRIKETVQIEGPRVITFANVLKYDLFPLARVLNRLLVIGEEAMGVPVEMEFAADMAASKGQTSQFSLLQMRPMTASKANVKVRINAQEKEQALCYTRNAVGNLEGKRIEDIVYVKPEAFDPGKTRAIANQVAMMNSYAQDRNRQYLLVGPGRWGTADPWLGIPVRWADISNVACVIETVSEKLKAEPSIGAHFFHNLISLGIGYLSVTNKAPDRFDWAWLGAQNIIHETDFTAYAELKNPVTLKVDGSKSCGIIF